MGEAAWLLVPLLSVMIQAFTPDAKPTPEPARHSPVPNFCHPLKATPEGELFRDYTVDLCRRARSATPPPAGRSERKESNQ
jgi:hypothetical protein